eukprot:356145-Chlamydomonas_euryale.AAC.1
MLCDGRNLCGAGMWWEGDRGPGRTPGDSPRGTRSVPSCPIRAQPPDPCPTARSVPNRPIRAQPP